MYGTPLRHGFLRACGPVVVGISAALLLSAVTLTAAPQSTSAPQAERVAVGDEAVDFTMQSIDGETYRLSDLRGEKRAIIIFFRGTW